MNKWSLLISVGLLHWCNAQSLAQTQEIFIEGVLRDRRDLNRSGQSVVIRPADETRYDVSVHFNADPSITVSGPRHGGFSLPLFRGQDARSSHVFVGDLELQDPFSGLPMVDEIDLRAFGTMTIHKGFAPWDIPVMDPGGVIQFGVRELGPGVSFGGGYGDVSGGSGWGKWTGRSDDLYSCAIYGRRSVKPAGSYYYSDNNTVLNSSDDSLRRQGNDDRASNQILLSGKGRSGRWSGQMIGWAQESQAGIPVEGLVDNGSARVGAATGLATASIRYALDDTVAVGMKAGFFQAHRKFRDDHGDVGFATRRSMVSASGSLGASLLLTTDLAEAIVNLERQEVSSKVDSNYSADLFSPRAYLNKLYVGIRYRISSQQAIEMKSSLTSSQARIANVEADGEVSASAKPNMSGSIGWDSHNAGTLIYGQMGVAKRAPSLLERVGNGAEIEGSRSLRDETSLAGEIGWRRALDYLGVIPWLHFPVLANVAIWSRENGDVIRIEKVAASRWRAIQHDRYKFHGIESRVDLGGDDRGVEFALSWIKAEMVSQDALVPRVPMWQAAGGARWRWNDRLIMRTASRFAGRMYDDISNSREVGWTLTHDVMWDYLIPGEGARFGLAIVNATDVRSVSVSDLVASNNNGREAYKGFNGELLPGRNYVFTASMAF